MTINQLHKLTRKFIDQGYGRRKVTIDKATFSSPLEDEGGTIIDVADADVQVIRLTDGDGFTELTASGRERVMVTLVIVGTKYQCGQPADKAPESPPGEKP